MFFESIFLSPQYAELVTYYARHSHAAKLGYVDPAKITRIYKLALITLPEERLKREQQLFRLYSWLCYEVSMHNHQRLVGDNVDTPGSAYFRT
jgi:hypothetical protein